MAKFVKSRGELDAELAEQILEFRARCAGYDSGHHWEAKSIASCAYKLLKDGGRNTRSLLGQLGLLNARKWVSSSWPIDDDPRSTLPLVNIIISLEKRTVECEPSRGEPKDIRHLPFSRWWEEPVYRNRNGKDLTRKNLICTMRDQDGGSHVDDAITNEEYHWLKSYAEERIRYELPPPDAEGDDRKVRFYIALGEQMPPGVVPTGALRATMRQIGWEIDETLKRLSL